ncbi:immunoglobulin domain-containing family protein [Magnetospirillum molischianum]|uniref:Uncharacterized protein n=1 Tax=Magnetospirillum molischianum DSM 120 TaxID=1150626 RepID=H8FNS9_MAGML|nr:hypothetical protein [Magnetospirillum molischianum]CCG40017.1 conserved exported hypothetical protein [Magnetospirillum molischianum DSM 120]
MRSIWPFFGGALVALKFFAFTVPILAVVAVLLPLFGTLGPDEAVLGGGSNVRMRDEGGRVTMRMSNTTYTQLSVPVTGEPRPRRLLLRQQTDGGTDGEGRIRLDAWPVGMPIDLRRPPIYTVHAQGNSANLSDDGLFWTVRNGRRSAWSLADGSWLFDTDLPLAAFTFEPDARRVAALAVADEELWSRGAVGVITYAAPGRVLRRVLLVSVNPLRGQSLRATLTASRLVSYTEAAPGGRVIELPLAMGPVRIPVTASDLDVAHASVPSGLKLSLLHPWGE